MPKLMIIQTFIGIHAGSVIRRRDIAFGTRDQDICPEDFSLILSSYIA